MTTSLCPPEDRRQGKPTPVPVVIDDGDVGQLSDTKMTGRLAGFAERQGADPDTARDMIQQAIMLLLAGELRWDREKQPNMGRRLFGIIRNELRAWRTLGRREKPVLQFPRG